MSKRSETNSPGESSGEPKSARISDGEITSDCLSIVLGVPLFHEEMSIVSELARWKGWVACLRDYITEIEVILDSTVCSEERRARLEETVNELYTIEEKLIGLSMITNSLQTKNGGSLDVCGLSIILVRKWTVLMRKLAMLKTMDDWIEFQGAGERMRSELLIAANNIMSAFVNMKSTQTRPISANSNSSGRSNNPSRKDRWSRLNEVLKLAGKQTKNESTPCSSISWDQVACIFSTTPYEQHQKDIGTKRAQFLEKYLVYVSKCSAKKGNEAQRIHLIAPILYCVGSLLDDVQILIEKELKGEFIQAHGRFEFVIKKGNKMICILEAKKEKIEQGMAQDLVGCELAAEGDGLDVVYGIVTNYVEWVFLRNTSEEIFEDHFSIATNSHGPQMEALKIVADKIYAILSDEDERKD